MTTLQDIVRGAQDLQAELDAMGCGRPDKAPTKTKRGASNGNSSGNAEDRRRRRVWLLDTYQANVDTLPYREGETVTWEPVQLGLGVKACRCYRCGGLLTLETLTVDRIIPGCKGGTYRRNNIRPACGDCNSETGGRLGAERSKTAR